MNWLKNLIIKAKPKKSAEEVFNELGAFQYHEDGFTITYKDFSERVNWEDIDQLNAYKVDLMSIDRIDLEIVYSGKVFAISEDLPGWYRFINKLQEVFPAIPMGWDEELRLPAFETNYIVLYSKDVNE